MENYGDAPAVPSRDDATPLSREDEEVNAVCERFMAGVVAQRGEMARVAGSESVQAAPWFAPINGEACA